MPKKIVDVFVAGFPRTGRAPRRLWRRRPMLFVSPRFVPEPCVLFFISRRREWRLQPAASSVTGQCLWSNQPHLHLPRRAQFSCLCFSDFYAHALRTSSSWQERSRILSSWRTSAPPTVMCVWYRTLFTRIPAGVCWCYMPAPRREHGARGGDSGRSRLLTRPLLCCLCVCV